MLEELQALDAGQIETAQIETHQVRFAEEDVVALNTTGNVILSHFP